MKLNFPLSVIVIASLAACGCDSTEEIDAAYKLEEYSASTGPGDAVVDAVNYLEERLRSRESDPAYIVGETRENLEGFTPDQFGEQASVYEQVQRELEAMQKMIEDGAPRAQLVEQAGAIKDAAAPLASSGTAPVE